MRLCRFMVCVLLAPLAACLPPAPRGPSGSGQPGTGAGSSGNPSGDKCGSMTYALKRGVSPEVMILQDKSASMANLAADVPPTIPNDPNTKWRQMIAAIENTVQTGKDIEW